MNVTLNKPKNATPRHQALPDMPPSPCGNIAGDVPAPEPGDRVENRIACLLDTVELLQKEAVSLREALESVLQPDSLAPGPGVPDTGSTEVACQVVDRLRSLNSAFLSIASHLANTRNRLRL